MRMRLFLLPVASVLLCAQGAEDIVAKHLQARGGLKAIQAIQSLRITLRASPREFPGVTEYKRPMRYRSSLKVQGVEWIQAWDGTSGWTINPFSGYGGFKEPQPLSEEERRSVELDADLDGPLVDWKAKGSALESLPDEEVEGTPAQRVKLTLKNGDQITYFFDAENHMEIKRLIKRKVRGTEVELETVFGNYEQAGGVWFPRLIQSGEKSSEQRWTVLVDKVEVNPNLDDARFQKPAKAAQ